MSKLLSKEIARLKGRIEGFCCCLRVRNFPNKPSGDFAMAEHCDGFQHPLGGNVKKCMECGAITAHFGRHEKMAEQPTRISGHWFSLRLRAGSNSAARRAILYA